MRATWPGARSGRIRMTTWPLVVSSVSVFSALVMDVLCLLEFSIVDEPHGKRAAGDCVPERIGERQGRATFEHLGHGNAVGQPFVIRCAAGFECDPRLAEEFAVAPEAHLHRDLHARARLIDWR